MWKDEVGKRFLTEEEGRTIYAYALDVLKLDKSQLALKVAGPGKKADPGRHLRAVLTGNERGRLHHPLTEGYERRLAARAGKSRTRVFGKSSPSGGWSAVRHAVGHLRPRGARGMEADTRITPVSVADAHGPGKVCRRRRSIRSLMDSSQRWHCQPTSRKRQSRALSELWDRRRLWRKRRSGSAGSG